MGSALAFLTFAALQQGPARPDTVTFADSATRALVMRAMARHSQQDSSVRDYSAKLRYRVSFGLAKRKWGDPLPIAVEEQDARILWQLPNDLRVDMLGRRSASQYDGLDLSSTFSHPWFLPRTLGDSIRVFGASQTPARAAPHPLARGAEHYYQYAAGDSLKISSSAGQVTVQAITVTPKLHEGAFVTGRVWVDTHTGDMVRFSFRFVGTDLWTAPDGPTPRDSAAARRTSKFVNHILELNADLEFSLQDNKYWMPYRQVIAGKLSVPLGIDLNVPFQAQTTFDDYRINTGATVAFDAGFPRDTNARGRNRGRLGTRSGDARQRSGAVADSNRARSDSGFRARFRNRTGYLAGGGRYEIHRPPADSMQRYNGWGDSLVLSQDANDRRRIQQTLDDLAHLADKLPGDMTGKPTLGLGWERIADILRYNRVEGTTVSLGAHTPLPVSFSQLYGTVRYGFADRRVMARLDAVRDAPSGRFTLSAERDLVDLDPFSRGLTFGNSLRGIITGHDDGDYLLAQGGRVTLENGRGAVERTWTAYVEDQSSVQSRARAFFPRIAGSNGYFPATDSVRQGLGFGGALRLDHSAIHSHWTLQLDGTDVASRGAARLSGELRFSHLANGRAALSLKAGGAIGSDSVPQLALHAGGSRTVRGYDFGVERGAGMWSAQLDVTQHTNRPFALVGFVDAGQAADWAAMGHTTVLAGAGIGASVLRGLFRFDLSHPLTATQGRGFRFDIIFGAPR